MSQPPQCAYIGAGEGTLRVPFGPLAQRVLPALQVRFGSSPTPAPRRRSRTWHLRGRARCAGPRSPSTRSAPGRRRARTVLRDRAGMELLFVRREERASLSGWPARATPHGRPRLSPKAGAKRRTAQRLTAVVDRALPDAEDRPALMPVPAPATAASTAGPNRRAVSPLQGSRGWRPPPARCSTAGMLAHRYQRLR